MSITIYSGNATLCPGCTVPVLGTVGIPKAGALSLCATCGVLCRYTETLELEEAPDEALEQLPSPVRDEMKWMMARIRRRGGST